MKPVTLEFRVTPMGKPRQTQQDKWMQRPAVMRYRAFEDAIQAAAAKHRFTMPESGAVITFRLPMPKSWSARKRAAMEGQPHRQKPDVDNCLKAFLDSLCADDCAIWNVSVEKRWSEYGRIDVAISPLREEGDK